MIGLKFRLLDLEMTVNRNQLNSKFELIYLHFHLCCRETEKHREKEQLAAVAIQTNWRMLKVKWNYQKKVRACILVSRVFRGHIARLRVNDVN